LSIFNDHHSAYSKKRLKILDKTAANPTQVIFPPAALSKPRLHPNALAHRPIPQRPMLPIQRHAMIQAPIQTLVLAIVLKVVVAINLRMKTKTMAGF